MPRIMLFVMLIAIFVPSFSSAVPDYISPDGWMLRYMSEFSGETVERGSNLGRMAGAGKMFCLIDREPGEWWNFVIRVHKGLTVCWGPDTKVTLVTEDSTQTVESEACFFTESPQQRQVWDCQRVKIYLELNQRDIFHFVKGQEIAFPVLIKFPAGSVTQSEVKKVIVEGVTVFSS